jgi:hypothetical protein
MIEQYFPSKRKTVEPYKYQNRYQHPLSLPNNTAYSAFEEARALKMGVTKEVYRHRVTEVSRAQSACPFQIGDTVYPALAADVELYGACLVTGICRHYHDYGTVDWHEPPFILSIQSIGDRSSVLNTTTNWVVKKKNIFESENFGDC